MGPVSREFHLGRRKMIGFLNEAEHFDASARTLYFAPGTPLKEVEDSLTPFPQIAVEAAEKIALSKTGAVFFMHPGRQVLIVPPLPVREKAEMAGFSPQGLLEALETEILIAVVLVRLGSYSIGLFRGEKLVSSKTGTGLVHGRHKKGGSSQARFSCHREKQMEQFFTRVCSHIREHLEPAARDIDYMAYGGAWTTILALKKQCEFLGKFEDRLLPPLLDLPEPRREVLDSAVRRLWSSRVIIWQEES